MEFIASDLNRRNWDDAVSGAGGATQQCWRYGQMSGCRVARYDVVEDGARIGMAQVLSRRFWPGFDVHQLDRGPVWIHGPPAGGWLEHWRAPGPLIHTGENANDTTKGLPLMSSATLAHLDLTPDLADLRKGMHQKWRNRLKSAERAAIGVEPSKNLDWIIAREGDNRSAHRYRGWPPEFVRGFCRDPSAWRLFLARHHGQSVAGALFLLHGTSATYHIGWSGSEGRKLNAQALVLWTAIRRLKSLGIKGMDLGLIDTHRAPGLARFKLGIGARAHRLGPTRLILRRPIPQKANFRTFHRAASVK